MTGEGAPNMPAGGPVRLPGQGQWSGTALLRSGPANGTTTIGVYKPSAATFYLRNQQHHGQSGRHRLLRKPRLGPGHG